MKRALSVAATAVLVLLLTPVTAMAADGTIRGTVTRSGGPVANACVDVHVAGDSVGRTIVTANSAGFYTVDVPAGQYVLRFSDCAAGDYAQEWFNDEYSFSDADVVTVPSGGSVTANAQLAAAAGITGRVAAPNGTGLTGMCVSAQDPEDPMVRSATTSGANGTFTVGGLPTGTFVVSAKDCANNPATRATSWYSGSSTPARGADSAMRIATSTGQTATLTATLPMPGAATVSGTLVGAPAGICVVAIDMDSNTSAGTTTTSGGAWSISGLLPGSWIIKVSDCRDIAAQNKLATGFIGDGGLSPSPASAKANPLELDQGGNATGVDTMRAGGALTGKLRTAENSSELRTPSSGGDAIVGACVGVTAPNSLEIIQSVVTSSSGASFTIGGLDPALDYRVLAFNCGNNTKFGLEWHGDSLLLGDADGVGVTAGSTLDIANLEVGNLVRRAAGQHRRLTANALALGGWTSATNVVLASEAVYADALAGAPFASLVDAPLLLVDGSGLTPDVADTINRLGATNAWILGGHSTITPAMEGQLGQQTGVTAVGRLGGVNRFETARKIALQMEPFVDTSRAYVVEGDHALDTRGWPDAMSVAGLAAFEQVPLLLVTADQYPDFTKQTLDDLGVMHVDIVGGPAAVSDAVKDAIDADVGTVSRISGADRYGTSMAVVDAALARGAWSRTVWMASGLKFPDSLVGGAAVARDGGILMLVNGNDSAHSPATEAKLVDLAIGIDRVIILGGEATISQTTANKIVDFVD